jgi:glycosyltransferase involved in cell wall biosynthesis
MLVYYHLSEYISHRLSGLDFISCLESLGHEVVTGDGPPKHCDVAILHDDPLNYPALFSRYPHLHAMRSIAYCVWENETPAEAYKEPLGLVTEIWTPSAFSQRGFLRDFSAVRILPHLVRRRVPSPEDLAFARGAVRADEKAYRFFSIVDSLNPRKNLRGLLEAFAALRAVSPRKVRLILKQYRVDFDFSGLPDVIGVNADLSPGRMAALHVVTDAYVSAHHAEGWGLGLTEAMAYGKPVLATGYSGNMEFMDQGNSLPLPYRMAPVSEEMCERIPLFTRRMRWADIDRDALVTAMKKAAAGRIPQEISRRAAEITRRFGPEAVARRMRALLDDTT